MTDAPETIWRCIACMNVGAMHCAHPNECGNMHEYSCSGPPATDAQALANPKVRALVEAAALMLAGHESEDCRTIAGYHALGSALAAMKGDGP